MSTERALGTGNIPRNDGATNKNRTIVVKFQGIKILNTYRQKKLWKKKIFVNQDFSEETASIRKGLLQKVKYLRLQ